MTRLVLIDELLPRAMIYARSAPEPLVLEMLRDAVRTFCSVTRVWRENDAISIAAPDFEGLCSFAGTEIVAIEAAQLDGVTLTPIAIQDLDRKRKGWRTDTDEAAASYITQLQPNSVTVYPRQTGTLDMGLVLMPSTDALTVPDWLVSRYGKRIGRGAAGELLVLPNTEYGNAQLGAALIAEFGRTGGTALRTAKGQQGARIRAKGSFF